MPMYTYIDKKSKKQFDILRHFSEYDSLPTEEEALAAGMTAKQYAKAKWEKLIGGGIRVIRGENWGPGRKGHW